VARRRPRQNRQPPSHEQNRRAAAVGLHQQSRKAPSGLRTPLTLGIAGAVILGLLARLTEDGRRWSSGAPPERISAPRRPPHRLRWLALRGLQRPVDAAGAYAKLRRDSLAGQTFSSETTDVGSLARAVGARPSRDFPVGFYSPLGASTSCAGPSAPASSRMPCFPVRIPDRTSRAGAPATILPAGTSVFTKDPGRTID
jgi:hypothetical protein